MNHSKSYQGCKKIEVHTRGEEHKQSNEHFVQEKKKCRSVTRQCPLSQTAGMKTLRKCNTGTIMIDYKENYDLKSRKSKYSEGKKRIKCKGKYGMNLKSKKSK